MRRVCVIWFILYCFSTLHAQYLKGPIILGDYIPAEFKDIINRKFTDIPLYKEKNQPQLRPIFSAADGRVKLIIGSGRILYGDTVTTYLRKIGDKLLAFAPAMKVKPHFFIEIDNYPNAYTYPDGTIIFTTGLLSRLNTESELAFIMGHEITHYAKDHSVLDFYARETNKKEFGTDLYDVNSRTRRLFYSREFESDADATGLDIVMKAGYNGYDAIKALKSTDDIDSQYKDVIVLKKYFQNDPFKIDSTAGSGADDDNHYGRKSKGRKATKDDRQSTHPNLEKRGIALNELLQNMAQKQAPSMPDDSAKYSKIKNITAMEMPEAAYLAGNYIEGLYTSLYLLEKYPDNNYLQYMISKNLLKIAYAQDIDSLLNGQRATANFGKGYDQVNTFIKDLTQNESKKLAYSYIKSLYAKKKDVDEINFYMGNITEFYLGAHVAEFYYARYLETFPKGKYAVLAKSKMVAR